LSITLNSMVEMGVNIDNVFFHFLNSKYNLP
jgi:hypothetical protein